MHLLKLHFNDITKTLNDMFKINSLQLVNLVLLTLTRLVDSSSDNPMGSTNYLSHKILWQLPKVPRTYFSRIIVKPRGEIMYRAWIRPYRSIAD